MFKLLLRCIKKTKHHRRLFPKNLFYVVTICLTIQTCQLFCFCFLPPTLYSRTRRCFSNNISEHYHFSFNFNCPTKHTHVDNKCLGVRANLRPITQLSCKGVLNLTDFQQAFAPLHEKLLIPTK